MRSPAAPAAKATPRHCARTVAVVAVVAAAAATAAAETAADFDAVAAGRTTAGGVQQWVPAAGAAAAAAAPGASAPSAPCSCSCRPCCLVLGPRLGRAHLGSCLCSGRRAAARQGKKVEAVAAAGAMATPKSPGLQPPLLRRRRGWRQLPQKLQLRRLSPHSLPMAAKGAPRRLGGSARPEKKLR